MWTACSRQHVHEVPAVLLLMQTLSRCAPIQCLNKIHQRVVPILIQMGCPGLASVKILIQLMWLRISPLKTTVKSSYWAAYSNPMVLICSFFQYCIYIILNITISTIATILSLYTMQKKIKNYALIIFELCNFSVFRWNVCLYFRQ